MPGKSFTNFMISLLLCSFTLQAQKNVSLAVMEDSLSSLQYKIQKTKNDSIRQSLNMLFKNKLEMAISLPGSFYYPFDSLKKVAKLISPDRRFRMFNWNMPNVNNTDQYFCFLQIPLNKSNTLFKIIELTNRSDSIPDPERSYLTSGCWYGALYYKIITENSKNGMIYTLLGWEEMNLFQMQKVIEILTFDENNNPHFGKKVFKNYKDGENRRVIFKYSPSATMVLRFEEQSISTGKKWNSSQRAFEEKHSRAPMIVCDRIVTMDSQESKGAMLVPAGDVYDGFIFKNDCWNFLEGVDARNN
jgi:hypothetical protein